jgi:putative transposase
VETDEYFHQVLRYLARNALRANLVKRAEDWPFACLSIHHQGSVEDRALLLPSPLPRPRKRLEYVNEAETEAELQALRRSAVRGSPVGNADWVAQTAKKLGLESTLRSPHPPKSQLNWTCPRLSLSVPVYPCPRLSRFCVANSRRHQGSAGTRDTWSLTRIARFFG